MTNTKCACDPCDCSVQDGKQYCSDRCKDGSCGCAENGGCGDSCHC